MTPDSPLRRNQPTEPGTKLMPAATRRRATEPPQTLFTREDRRALKSWLRGDGAGWGARFSTENCEASEQCRLWMPKASNRIADFALSAGGSTALQEFRRLDDGVSDGTHLTIAAALKYAAGVGAARWRLVETLDDLHREAVAAGMQISTVYDSGIRSGDFHSRLAWFFKEEKAGSGRSEATASSTQSRGK